MGCSSASTMEAAHAFATLRRSTAPLRVRFDVAVQRGALWNGYPAFMGLPAPFFAAPRRYRKRFFAWRREQRSGSFSEAGEVFEPMSWLRLPEGARTGVRTSRQVRASGSSRGTLP